MQSLVGRSKDEEMGMITNTNPLSTREFDANRMVVEL
jgi:hypothetical protein